LFNEKVLEKFGSFGEDSTPHRVVKLGDGWAIHLEEPSNAGPLNVDLKCTFKNWEQHADRKCMRIMFTGTVQAAPNAASLPVKIENGRVSGETWFDPQLEMIVEIAFDADMNLKITRQGQTLTVSSQPERPASRWWMWRTWRSNPPGRRASGTDTMTFTSPIRFVGARAETLTNKCHLLPLGGHL
jgi:hypothetical protein